MVKRLLPEQRVSLARELSESCRMGPRVWSLVGLAFLITGIFHNFVWVALALWLVFVLREVLFGMVGWIMSEFLRRISEARTVAPNNEPQEPKVVSSAAPSSRGGIIDVRAEEVTAAGAGPAPRRRRQAMQP